ncbi:lipoprotein-releasing ABC transporter permease subunit [Xylella fastidiosa]|uniref:lipoprotein-releasing ABC transporter permease subunit n=1 Tax=Xylella fastidiosa TaxID=2371 RepID=UPI000FE352A1|nr:lipoprotein-releasing ABC transporter permease subunit [Xylella fastidiosa]MRT33972.1 lipoprotein-releasing ABC transporter permease subunit [Xylella fastidiosa subsp. multiplex]MRT45699.1 lipoprotein-releasing ABC transporter permease subunit [Xylella fastidiosa subsp. multiplex]MRT95896.1 lipoprotein-releasing ABC transporter permease subunit [Xylella fastidiosa subsp. multiplex]MRU28231.1 lipoprotein-releasing ABC transporter permease subunit [Xylella fastidiosa subsp. multiplex]MRU30621
MFNPLSVAIGLRYLRAKRRNGFISFISMASILGIALGVTVLITTLAVMSGFQKEIRDRLLQMAAHATVSAQGAPMHDWQHAVALAMTDPRVAGAAPYIESEALLQGERHQPAMMRGIVPNQEAKVSVLAQKLKVGSIDSLKPGEYNILLGKELALWLGVDVGDSVIVLLSQTQTTPVGTIPRMKRFTVSGLFEVGYNEIDRGLAVVNMEDMQKIMRMDGVTGVRLKLHDMDHAWDVASDLAVRLNGPYLVSDWTRENANLYSSLKMEKTVMGILLSLIIAMGAFNLVSSQVMLVTDKQADIAILRTLGLSPAGVMRVFMVQGSLIGIIGTLSGVIGGVVLTWNLERILKLIESTFNITLLPEDVYYITGLPTDMQFPDVVVITLMALAMSFIATLYPAWRAARIQPAEALRYE